MNEDKYYHNNKIQFGIFLLSIFLLSSCNDSNTIKIIADEKYVGCLNGCNNLLRYQYEDCRNNSIEWQIYWENSDNNSINIPITCEFPNIKICENICKKKIKMS